MASESVVVALSIAAAAAFAASSSLKHVSAREVPDAQSLHPHRLGQLIAGTLAHRFWLAGLACDAVGLALQTAALHFGALAVVQPLLVVGLLFALVFRHLLGDHHVTKTQAGWAVLTCAALAGFLIVAGDGGPGGTADRLPAVIAGAVGLVMTAACIELARRQGGKGRAGALLGVGVGVVYAATAALLKSVTNVAAHGLLAVVTSWQIYALVAAGAAGLLLNQVAFQAGPITASLPATATVDPLLSVVVGVLVYDEHLNAGPGHGVVLAAILLALVVAVARITKLDDNNSPRAVATRLLDSRDPTYPRRPEPSGHEWRPEARRG